MELCSPYLESSEKAPSFQATLILKGGLYDQVGQRLKEKGYNHQILTGTNSKNEVFVKTVLINIEASEQRQEKIKQIWNDYIIKNNLDPKVFKLKVTNDETLNW